MALPILATLLYSLREFYSKRILTEGISKYGLILSMRFYGILVLLIIFLLDPSQLDFSFISSGNNEVYLLVLSILVGLSGIVLMYEVLSKVKVGHFGIIKSLGPLATLLVSFLFLGERLAFLAYVGVFMIVASVFYLNYKDSSKSGFREQWRSVLLIFLSFLLMATGNVIYASTSSVITPLTYSVVLFTVNILIFGSYILFISNEKLRVILSPRKDLIVLGIVATLAMFILNYSFTILSPTIVNTVMQLQIFLMILAGYFIFKEKSNLFLKASMATVSFSGICLILFSTSY